jgi:hypothetical protein
LLVKVDPTGDFIWSHHFGVGSANGATSVEETTDGGFILVGWNRVSDEGDRDVYVVKTDSTGELEWEVTLGDSGEETGLSVLEVSGGYVVAGTTESPEFAGDKACLMHIDAEGELVWKTILGPEGTREVADLTQTSRGYLLTAVFRNPDSEEDAVYVARTDFHGNILEDMIFGIGVGNSANYIQRASDGGYIVAGFRFVSDVDYLRRPYLLRTDPEGKLVWDLTMHGEDSMATCVRETHDGGYVVGVSGYLVGSLVKLGAPTAIPSDCNLDGVLDISDGICLLGHLFVGGPENLPCGEGTLGDLSNVALLDSTGDSNVDISDAVRLFGFLFLGSQPPVLGTACRAIPGCPNACTH